MCGVFGYIGSKNNSAEIVLKGLKSLEYRGYDSWGIVVRGNPSLKVDKHVGKISVAETKLPHSDTALGHDPDKPRNLAKSVTVR